MENKFRANPPYWKNTDIWVRVFRNVFSKRKRFRSWTCHSLQNLTPSLNIMFLTAISSDYHVFPPFLLISSHSFKLQIKCHHFSDSFLTTVAKMIALSCLFSFTSGCYSFFRTFTSLQLLYLSIYFFSSLLSSRM